MSHCGAIVLTGGASRRMGRPKELLPFEGEALLTRVVRRVASFASDIVVVAQSGQELPPCPPGRVVRDPFDDAGPLVAIGEGLHALQPGDEEGWVFVCGTDSPFVTGEVVMRMVELGDGYDAVVPEVGGKKHVLTGIYRRSLSIVVDALVGSGVRRASALSETSDTRFVTAEELLGDPAVRAADPELRTLINANTPEEWARVLASRN